MSRTRRSESEFGMVHDVSNAAPLVLLDGNLTITRNGYVTEMHKFREQMNKLLPELGLTPASRQKLTSLKVEDDGDDAFASIMKRMGRG
jgi:P27 family predicted phage terminase small subunit